MIRILYVLNDTLLKGGTERVVLNYLKYIDKTTFSIDFMLHTTKEEAERNNNVNRLISRGTKVHCVTPRRISFFRNRREILDCLSNYHYDIVHAHADAANAIILGYAKKSGIQIRVAHSHSSRIPIVPDSLKNILHIIALQFCRIAVRGIATDYVACSDKAAIWLFGKRNYDNNRVHIIHNAIDLKKYEYNPHIREEQRKNFGITDSFVIGHIGRFSREKNQEFLLHVFRRVKEQRKDAKLMLVGSGVLFDYIVKKTGKLGIENDVIFTGDIENINEVINAFDIYCMPSMFEGLSISLIEAQANGLWCVVSDTPKVSKESDVSNHVKFLPVTDPCIWAEYIDDFFEERDDKASFKIRSTGYDITSEVKRLESFYKRVYECHR